MSRTIFSKAANASTWYFLFAVITLYVSYRVMLGNFGLAAVGIWSTLFACASSLKVFDLAASSTITLLVKEATFGSSTNRIEPIFWTYTLISLLLLGTGLLTAVALSPYWLPLLKLDKAVHEQMFILAAVAVLLSTIATNLIAVYDGMHQFGAKYTVISVSNLLFLIFLAGIGKSLGVIVIPLAFCLQNIIQIVLLISLLDRTKVDLTRGVDWNVGIVKSHLNFSIQSQLSNVLATLIEPAAKIFVQIYDGAMVGGLFDLANQIVQKLRMFAALILQGLFPAIRIYARSDLKELQDIYLRTLRVTRFATFSSAAMLLLFSNLIAGLFSIDPNGGFYEIFFPLVLLNVAGLMVTPAYFVNFSQGWVSDNLAYHAVAFLVFFVSMIAIRIFAGAGSISIVSIYAIAMIAGAIYLMLKFHKRCRLRPWAVFEDNSALIWSSFSVILFSYVAHAADFRYLTSDMAYMFVPIGVALAFLFINRLEIKSYSQAIL